MDIPEVKRSSFKKRLWLCARRRKKGVASVGKENRNPNSSSNNQSKKDIIQTADATQMHTVTDSAQATSPEITTVVQIHEPALQRKSKSPGIADPSEDKTDSWTDLLTLSGPPGVGSCSDGKSSNKTGSQAQLLQFSKNSTPCSSLSATPSLIVEPEDDPKENEEITEMSGRRIVDIQFFLEQITAINHKPFNCTIKDLEFEKEVRSGFQSCFIFTCKMCGMKETFKNDKVDSQINREIVQAVVCSGSGYSQLDEFCGHLNMPCMSDKTFIKNNMLIGEIIKDAALNSMYEAGIEEKRLAIEKGHVDVDGVPYITVVADASWGKRSYRTSNYNSLSGVACIIGYETKKVLFLGIRNSYCSVCAVASNKNVEPKPHKCFKNWTGSSTAMEADGVVEGFKCSINMHGLKYKYLIGDGDSSVTSALNEALPYGHMTSIQKIECSNHLLRNYCTKLRNLEKKTENKHGSVPIILRKYLSNNIMRLRKAINGAVDHNRNQTEKTTAEKVNSLMDDLRNGPCHVFGEHTSCKEYFCKGRKDGEENYVSQLKECGLWYDIYTCLSPLINNAESLLRSMTNNIVEQFNSLIAKFIAGKRINYSLRGSYESRCYAAAVQKNTGSLMATLHQASNKNEELGTYSRSYQKRRLSRLQRKSTHDQRAKRVKRFAGPDEHYGDLEKEDDLECDEFERRKERFLDQLKKSPQEIADIQRNTTGQSSNPEWMKERKLRLTASVFGQVSKMRPSTSCKNIVKTLLYSTFKGSDATRYGIRSEPLATKDAETLIGEKITPCGLFIDELYPYLGASPDGLIGNDSILEIKCPAVAAQMTPTEAILQKKITFCTIDNNSQTIKLKRNHNYYYQVQGQLNITKRTYCYFVVWTPRGMLYEKIEKDVTFWESNIVNKLKEFYMHCLLPEIIDPRLPRKLPIRDPLKK